MFAKYFVCRNCRRDWKSVYMKFTYVHHICTPHYCHLREVSHCLPDNNMSAIDRRDVSPQQLIDNVVR